VRAGLVGLLFLLLIPGAAGAQCTVDAQDSSEVHRLFEQKKWDDVVRVASSMTRRPADENFDLGLALAHLQRWVEARVALLAGERACPQQKRFDVELAGIAFEQKHYPEAAAWLRRGLKLGPKDDYANDFAGTVYLLMGNMKAALKYWSRVRKPFVESITFDPQLRVQRLVLDRAVAFSPEALLV
jgi:tetratricopeptide (TPR) repeat protein